MSRRILFYYSQLNIGGAEKSLIRLMNVFAEYGDQVTYLGRFSGGKGEYMLDKRVQKHWLSTPLNRKGKLRYYTSLFKAGIYRTYSLVSMSKWKKFDMAFIGLQGLSPIVVLKYLKVSKVCVFIRTDISSSPKKDIIVAGLKRYINRIDYFICVAGTVRDSLIKEIPESSSKAIVIYNILSVKDMRQKLNVALNPFQNESDSVFRIVTVCRISDKSKALFRMVRVCRLLIDDGFRFRWYIIGDGADLSALRKAIIEAGLQDVMITPGRVDNPFGYYRECDLVAMLSYYEGLCGVVNEAKIAGKAIIATEVSGIHEQLEHGHNGWIVDNDEDNIVEGMKKLLSDPILLKKLTNTVYPDALMNDGLKIEKLYSLAEK